MSRIIDELKRTDHKRYLGGLDFFKYIGPGLLVTVGFIDPGNWASNFAAGSEFGYALLWVVTLSTIMLIVLQHNVAHLGPWNRRRISAAWSTMRAIPPSAPCSICRCFSMTRCRRSTRTASTWAVTCSAAPMCWWSAATP